MAEPLNQKQREELWILFKEAALTRFRILPEISSISAALLVVATFNKDLLPLTVDVKLAISVLLIFIPLSLFMYLSEANAAAIKAAQRMNEDRPGFSDGVYADLQKIPIRDFLTLKMIRSLYPHIVVLSLVLFVALFIYHIWFG